MRELWAKFHSWNLHPLMVFAIVVLAKVVFLCLEAKAYILHLLILEG
jgi:hypothetical protein